jgi:hypothetical protein
MLQGSFEGCLSQAVKEESGKRPGSLGLGDLDSHWETSSPQGISLKDLFNYWPMIGQMACISRPDPSTLCHQLRLQCPSFSSSVWRWKGHPCSPIPGFPSWMARDEVRLKQMGEGLAGRRSSERVSAPEGGRLRQWLAAEWGLAEGRGKGGALLLKGPFHVEISQRECWRPRSPAGGNVRAPLSPLMSQCRLRFPAGQQGCIRRSVGGRCGGGVPSRPWAGPTQLRGRVEEAGSRPSGTGGGSGPGTLHLEAMIASRLGGLGWSLGRNEKRACGPTLMSSIACFSLTLSLQSPFVHHQGQGAHSLLGEA